MRGVSCRALREVSARSWPAEMRREIIGTEPVRAARCREVLECEAKSGLERRVGWSRIRRETRTGSLRWIARRRRVEGSILEGG
jgi:hypothetical protein